MLPYCLPSMPIPPTPHPLLDAMEVEDEEVSEEEISILVSIEETIVPED